MRYSCGGRYCTITADTYDQNRSNHQTTTLNPENERLALGDNTIQATDSKEAIGFGVRDENGVRIVAAANASTSGDQFRDAATASPPPGAVFVDHAHIPGSTLGMVDDERGYGDTDSLRAGRNRTPMPTITRHGDRVGVHEIVDGRLQFRMLRGELKSFPNPVDPHFRIRERQRIQQNLDRQQPFFMRQ